MEFLGLCRAQFWGYYGVGKAALVVIEIVVSGPSLLIAYCGVFGGRGIVDVLKILRDLFRTSSFSFLELKGIGCLLCKINISLLLLIS